MQDSKPGFALLCWFPFGGVASAALLMILLGHYNPVTDDFLPAGLMPYYYVYLIALIITSIAGSILVLTAAPSPQGQWLYRRALTRLLICCGTQLALWALFFCGLSVYMSM